MEDEIASMTDEALDEAVAAEVMGGRTCEGCERIGEIAGGHHWHVGDVAYVPRPSYTASGDEMVALIEAMRTRGLYPDIEVEPNGSGYTHPWYCAFDAIGARGVTLPRAVAEAALIATRQAASTAPNVPQAGQGEVEAVSRG